MTLPPGMYPPTPPSGPPPMYGQHLPPGGGRGSGAGGEDPPFSEAFDFSFSSYVTPTVVKVLYGGIVILAVVGYVMAVLVTFDLTARTYDFGFGLRFEGSPIPGVLMIALGWILPFLAILGARVSLEQALATVRTAQESRALRERADLWMRGARA